jgi:biotin operon repressor
MVNTSQVEMARKLGIRKQNVYRAIKALVKENILIEEIDDKGRRQLKLNHLYAWKGKLKHLGLRPQEIAEKEEHKR